MHAARDYCASSLLSCRRPARVSPWIGRDHAAAVEHAIRGGPSYVGSLHLQMLAVNWCFRRANPEVNGAVTAGGESSPHGSWSKAPFDGWKSDN